MTSKDDEEGTGASGAGAPYEIGYGKPPKHTRFQPGRSGNPKGRRKGVRNLMTDVMRTLKVPVKMRQGGRARTVSTQEGVLMLLRERALLGDARSADRVLELAVRFNNETSDGGPPPTLTPSDEAILAAFAAEIRAATAPSAEPLVQASESSDSSGPDAL